MFFRVKVIDTGQSVSPGYLRCNDKFNDKYDSIKNQDTEPIQPLLPRGLIKASIVVKDTCYA